MATRRHGRLEVVTADGGKFHIRLRSSNGRILMSSEILTGRQVKRARRAILIAMDEDWREKRRGCDCPACERESGANQ